MPDEETIDRRLRAVERSLTDGDHDVETLRETADLLDRVETLEADLEAATDRIAELEAATQAVRGYVGNIRSVNEDVERRADAALAAVDRLGDRLDDPERPADTAAQSRTAGTDPVQSTAGYRSGRDGSSNTNRETDSNADRPANSNADRPANSDPDRPADPDAVDRARRGSVGRGPAVAGLATSSPAASRLIADGPTATGPAGTGPAARGTSGKGTPATGPGADTDDPDESGTDGSRAAGLVQRVRDAL